MSPLAILATVLQFSAYLEVLKGPPDDPRWPEAAAWVNQYSAAVIASALDPRERTRLASEARTAKSIIRRHRAVELRTDGLTAQQIADRIAFEEGHPHESFDERTVRRWLSKADISSR
jgi:hypothetical protein